MDRQQRLAGLLLFLLALGLRTFHLGQSSLSTDEGWTVWFSSTPSLGELNRFLAEDGMPALERILTVAGAARADLGELLGNLAARDFHPPLHYLATWANGQLGATSEADLRLPSAVFGATACWLAWRLGLQVAGPRAALLAGLLAAVSAGGVYHSQEVRMYSLAMALATGAGLLWLQALATGSRLRAAAAGALVCLGALSQYLAGLVVPLALALLPLSYRRIPEGRGLALAFWLVVPMLPALAWLPALLRQASGRGQIGGALPPESGLYALALMGTGETVELTWPLAWLTVAVLAALWLQGARAGGPGPAGPLLLAWTAGPPALAFLASHAAGVRVLSPQHYVIFSGFGWVLVGAGLDRMLRGGRAARGAAGAMLLLLVGLNLSGLANWWTDPRFHRGSWREVAAYLRQEHRSGDLVVLQTSYCGHVFRYYHPEPAMAVDTVDQLDGSLLQSADRVWLVQNAAPVTDPAGQVEARVAEGRVQAREKVFPAFQGSEVVWVRMFERSFERSPEHRTGTPGR